MDSAKGIVLMLLRFVLLSLAVAGVIVGLGATFGGVHVGSFAVGLVMLWCSLYGIVRLLQGLPREV